MRRVSTLVLLASTLSLVACSPEAPKETDQSKAGSTEVVNYQPTGLLAKSLPEIADALAKGEITSEALARAYLARIELVDKNGPTLQAVLSINPNIMAEALALDAERATGNLRGALHGVPILLKDNIETKGNLATTAGALALIDNITGRDSPLVAGLRSEGALILGKTNLSQWANFRSEDSMSGWTALGGQVRNPHSLDRNPCGSSSGSGAAAAASLASGTVGTETNGSVICPSNANGVVGFKPTVGIVPQDLIIPISASQDTAGPMTKTVRGAAMMMNAMATAAPDMDFTTGLTVDALKGVRVGVMRYAEGGNKDIKAHFAAALKVLEDAGAILVEIKENPVKRQGSMGYDLLKYEFKDGLNKYLASTDPAKVKTRTLAELIAFNVEHADVEMPLFDQSIFDASEAMGPLTDEAYIKAVEAVQKANREGGIDKLMAEFEVAVLVAPSGAFASRVDPVNGDVWPRFPGAGGMAAQAGYPHITVPMGGTRGMSVGLSFMAGKNQDTAVMAYGYAYEQRSMKRLEPNYYKSAEDIPFVAKHMKPYDGGK